jgi:G3E family GTPase
MITPFLVVISGFLGAGKTTLCTNLIGYLKPLQNTKGKMEKEI